MLTVRHIDAAEGLFGNADILFKLLHDADLLDEGSRLLLRHQLRLAVYHYQRATAEQQLAFLDGLDEDHAEIVQIGLSIVAEDALDS